MDKVKSFVYNNRTVTIYVDPDPVNPIKDYDQYTRMTCGHRRYNLGHEQHSEPMTEAEVRESVDGIVAILPLSLFDHSGISISTGISRGFDCGQVGWGYITREALAKMGDTTEYELDDPRLLEIIREDVKTYDMYLQGECFGYEITGKNDDHLDSCWGFLGDVDYCEAEARSAAEHSTDPAVDREAAELESRVTYAGASS
jgi:hypothetical protein